MKAVAVHAFAGGFAIGVKKYFDVTRAYEPLGFGTDTLEKMGINVKAVGDHDVDNWPMPKYQIDVVFGNPRCGGFSGLGSNAAVVGESRGTGCRQQVDAHEVVKFGIRANAKFICFESVQQLYRSPVNRGFRDEMRSLVLDNGYRIADVLMNTQSFGNAQYRKRYFFVAYKRGINFNVLVPPGQKEMTTVGEVLRDYMAKRGLVDDRSQPIPYTRKSVEYDEYSYKPLNEEQTQLIKYLEEGESFNNLHADRGPAWFLKKGFTAAYRLSAKAKSNYPFGVNNNHVCRLRWDGPCPSLVGNCSYWVHPLHDRTFTLGELGALMGWPVGFIPAGNDPAAQLAKGIVPAAGEWIAQAMALSLENKFSADMAMKWSGATMHMADASDADIKEIDITGMAPRRTVNTFLPAGGWQGGEAEDE